MEITDVRIKLASEAGERLLAYCSITIDYCFVIRELKIIARPDGPFVAMPSRRVTARCGHCHYKNALTARFCSYCGGGVGRTKYDEESSRPKLYADIAHPIRQACRETLERVILEAFQAEQERAKSPDYVCRYDEFDVEADRAADNLDLSDEARPLPPPIRTVA